MKALRAHVRNGPIVRDDLVELAEGMELEVRPISRRVGDDGYTDEQREELLCRIKRGQADVAAGPWWTPMSFSGASTLKRGEGPLYRRGTRQSSPLNAAPRLRLRSMYPFCCPGAGS